MKFEIMDNNVSLTMNIFIIIANIINIVYNIPQMVKTYKSKSTKDLSSWFLFLRVIGNTIWIGYAIEVDSMMMLINTCVTVIASIFIGYYKVLELNRDRIEKNKAKLLHNYKNINYSKCNNENELSNQKNNEHGNHSYYEYNSNNTNSKNSNIKNSNIKNSNRKNSNSNLSEDYDNKIYEV
jgi:uncharacterized protein with PQ loop repeat